MLQRLFCYGTLRVAAVVARVTGRRFPARAALLPGHGVRRLCGTPYPALLARRGEVTAGRLYEGLTPVHLRRLDRYEGRLYRRCLVMVRDDRGAARRAWVYLVAPRYRHRLGAGVQWRGEDPRLIWRVRHAAAVPRRPLSPGAPRAG